VSEPSAKGPETLFDALDQQALLTACSPDYGWEAAAEHGGGDPMLGARAAAREVTRICLRILHQALDRAEEIEISPRVVARDRTFVLGLVRAVHTACDLVPLDSAFRQLMVDSWGGWGPWEIVGKVSVDLNDRDESPRIAREGFAWSQPAVLRVPPEPPSSEMIRLAVLRALGELLADPDLNRAVLPPFGPGARVWTRQDTRVAVTVQLKPDSLWVLLIDPMLGDLEALRAQWKERLREVARLRRHPLSGLMDQVMAGWLRRGFLGSFAGAILSDAQDLPIGSADPVFIPGNGVPLTVAIQPPGDGQVELRISVDHRAFDAWHGGKMHAQLRSRVGEILRDGGW
jgi:hypothetical protein